MKSVDLLIFIEHIARELDVACAIKCLMEKNHHVSVEIASIVYDLKSTLKKFRPKVVVVPFCYSAFDWGLIDVISAWRDAVYVNFCYEQVYRKIYKKIKAPKDDFAKQHAVHLVWTQAFADYLKENGVHEKNVFCNGNLNFSFYGQPYSVAYVSREDLAARYALDPAKRWVFIPENYRAAFYKNSDIKKLAKRGFGTDRAQMYYELMVDSFQEVVRWWYQAAESKDVELIIRPRPTNPRSIFLKSLVKIAGEKPEHLHIIKDGTVKEWIMASDVVMSSYSTVLMEAALAEKPVYIMLPFPCPEFLSSDWYDLVPKVTDFGGFQAAVSRPASESGWEPLHAYVKENMMGQGDPIAFAANLLNDVVGKKSGMRLLPPGEVIGRQISSFSLWQTKAEYAWSRFKRTPQVSALRARLGRINLWEKDRLSGDALDQRLLLWRRILK